MGTKVETLGKIQEKPKMGKIDFRDSHYQEKCFGKKKSGLRTLESEADIERKRYFRSEHQQDNDPSDSNPRGSSFQVIRHPPDVVKSTIRHPA